MVGSKLKITTKILFKKQKRTYKPISNRMI